MIWKKSDVDARKVKEISKKYEISLLEASIFVRRNIIDDRSVSFYLENDIRFLHNPFLFSEMEEAVDRINSAIESNESIFVFGDRDTDGITATVILVKTLRAFGAKVEWGLPSGDDSYGLTADVIQSLVEKGVSLLITVDCGISNIDEIDRIKQQGIDSIIVDHHNPHEYLPDAVAVINPKVEESGYPFKDLCGCAVASKLVWALHFSRTRYYSQPMYLLHIRPVNDAFAIDLVKLENLVETGRFTESIASGFAGDVKGRINSFIEGSEVCIFQAQDQQKQLEKVFGALELFPFADISPFIVKAFPSLEGKSLLKIKEKSRIARYSTGTVKEIDVFKNLLISSIIRSEKSLSDDFIDEMDLVALGTLADIMPLVDENRILVKAGLELLNKTKREGIRELIRKNDLHLKKIDARDVSWHITPAINASGRMGEPEKAVHMLLTDNPVESCELADYIIKLNDRRKDLGETVWESVMPEAKQCFDDNAGKFVLVAGKSIQRGITGIIAARLSKFFKVPAIVVAVLDKKIIGSIRSIDQVNAKDFLHLFNDLFTDFGGHDLAGGFTMPLDRLEDFRERFKASVAQMQLPEHMAETFIIDAEIPNDYLTPDLYKVVELFHPYGEGNPPLLFLSKGVWLKNLELIGKKDQSHLKMLIDSHKYKWPAIFWNSAGRVNKDFSEGDTVDIIYNLSMNYFQYAETLRLNIMDMKRSSDNPAQ